VELAASSPNMADRVHWLQNANALSPDAKLLDTLIDAVMHNLGHLIVYSPNDLIRGEQPLYVILSHIIDQIDQRPFGYPYNEDKDIIVAGARSFLLEIQENFDEVCIFF
jgi:hypothetical protein